MTPHLVHIPYWWHATVFEIGWLVSGLVAGSVTVLNVRDSRLDKPVVDALKNDPTIHERHWQMIALAAKSREESQWTRLIICLLITASGLFGVLQANPLGGYITWSGVFVTVTLLGIAALTAARSLLDYFQRAHLYDLAMGRTDVTAARLRARHLPDNVDPQEEP